MKDENFLCLYFNKSSDIVAREIADEFLLVPISRKTSDVESIYALNKVATFIWNNINGKNNTGDILKEILKNFEISEKEAEEDIKELLNNLEQLGAICRI